MCDVILNLFGEKNKFVKLFGKKESFDFEKSGLVEVIFGLIFVVSLVICFFYFKKHKNA
jgi:uncharacterized membrane protein YciS (DUF1049 family)